MSMESNHTSEPSELSSRSLQLMMELPFLSFPYLFTFMLFLLMVLQIVSKKKTSSTPKLPPGPWKLPIIGNIHQFLGSDLPHRRLRDLAKKYGPLMRLQLGELPIVVISSAEFAKEVIKKHDIIFASRPFILSTSIISPNDIAFAPYGAHWRQLRKLCILELLSIKRVQSFRPLREEETLNMIKFISTNTGSLINLTEKFFSMTYSVTSKAAIGKLLEGQEEFITLVKETIEVGGGLSVADLYPSMKILGMITGLRPKVEKIHQKIDRRLASIIDEHKARKVAAKTGDVEADHEDLVDVLLRLQEDGDLEIPLTMTTIKSVILDMFVGGIETSSNTLGWAVSELLRNPKVMKKAQDEVRRIFSKKENIINEDELHELSYLKLIIKETLRLHPALPLLVPRESRERCEINGYEIPAKTQVLVNAFAINTDAENWPNPESFIPERFADNSIDYKGTHFEYLPFGGGRRICPGMSFGIANVELPLANLLYHFDWKLPKGEKPEDLDMSEVFGAAVSRKKDLCVIPIAYNPSTAE